MAFTSTLSVTESPEVITKLNRYTVWERVIVYTIDAGDGSTKTAQIVPINGLLQTVTATSGTAAGISGTFTLSIEDNSDVEIFTTSGPAEGASAKYSMNEPLAGNIDVYIDPNDDPTSGSWTVTVALRGLY